MADVDTLLYELLTGTIKLNRAEFRRGGSGGPTFWGESGLGR